MTRFLFCCSIFCSLLSIANAQSYEMSPDFIKELSSDSFAQSIMVLSIDDAEGGYPNLRLAPLKKLSNLRELNFKHWVYGKERETLIQFNVETFEQMVKIDSIPKEVNSMQVLELLDNYPDLEVLNFSFQNQNAWEAMHDYYGEELFQLLLKDLDNCWEKDWQDIAKTKKRFLASFGRSVEEKGIDFNSYPFNKIPDATSCLGAAFSEKWKAYFQFEKNYHRQREMFAADGWKFLGYFIPKDQLENLKKANADLPEIAQMQKVAPKRHHFFRQQAQEGLRALGLSGYSPIEQLMSQLPQLQKLKVLEIKDYPDLEQELPQLLKVLAKLPNLEILKIEHCHLKKLPKEIALLKKLKALYLSNNEIEQVGRGLDQLKSLEILDLSHNPIRTYEDAFYQCSSIKALNLAYCPIFPPRIEELSQLTDLSLEGCPILTLQEINFALQSLLELEKLNLKSTGLGEFPSNLKYLRNLDELNLENNQLSEWPIDFASWPAMSIQLEANFLAPLTQKVRPTVYGLDLQWKYLRSSFSHRQISKADPIQRVELLKEDLLPLDKDQEVYLASKDWQKTNKGFSFGGTLHLPSARMETDFGSYNMNSSWIELNHLKVLELYLLARKRSPEGLLTGPNYNFKEKISSQILNFHAKLHLNPPYNKLFPWEEEQGYPFLESLDTAYVYYPNYDQKQFYISLKPFQLRDLDSLSAESLRFDAQLDAGFLSTPLNCTLKPRLHDLSLGFEQEVENLVLYSSGLRFKGLLDLSNEGLLAQGELSTENWRAQADYIRFEMDRIYLNASEFKMKKGKKQKNVQLLYFPYEDKLLMSEDELPFSLWSAANHDFLMEAGILNWPIPSSKGKHFIAISQLKTNSIHQFHSEGEMSIYCYFPLSLANIILEDFDAAVLEEMDREEAAFIFNNLSMNWDAKKGVLESQAGDGLSQKIRLNAIAGQMVDRPLAVQIEIKPDEQGDQFEWYFEKSGGHWYYFSLKNNQLETLSNHEAYNEAVKALKKKERLSKLPNRQKFEIKLARVNEN
jgi:hypothetical protein